jgi:hypothetical protein
MARAYEPLRRGPLHAVHEEFMDAEIEWKALDGAIEPAAREFGRRAFQARALDEQRSLLAFSELLAELAESGAPVDVIGAMSRVVRDEALHVDLCGQMVERLGGFDADAPAPSWVRSNKKWPLRKRVLGTVLGSMCVGESISVAIFKGCRDRASEPTARAVLTKMLADESFHARFGFWWLESMPLREEELPFAEMCLTSVFRSVRRDLIPAQLGKPFEPSPFGSMSPDDRRAAVLDTMEKIVASFEKVGLPAKRVWSESDEASSKA